MTITGCILCASTDGRTAARRTGDTDASTRTIRATLETSDRILAVAVADGTAYLACPGGGLRLADVREPAAPQWMAAVALPGVSGHPADALPAAVVQVAGRVYVAARVAGVIVVKAAIGGSIRRAFLPVGGTTTETIAFGPLAVHGVDTPVFDATSRRILFGCAIDVGGWNVCDVAVGAMAVAVTDGLRAYREPRFTANGRALIMRAYDLRTYQDVAAANDPYRAHTIVRLPLDDKVWFSPQP